MARQPKADVEQASVAADDGKGLAPACLVVAACLVAKSAGSRRQIRALGESRKNIPIANCPASDQQVRSSREWIVVTRESAVAASCASCLCLSNVQCKGQEA